VPSCECTQAAQAASMLKTSTKIFKCKPSRPHTFVLAGRGRMPKGASEDEDGPEHGSGEGACGALLWRTDLGGGVDARHGRGVGRDDAEAELLELSSSRRRESSLPSSKTTW